MFTPTYTILFVANPQASGTFYSRLFGLEPVETSPTFVLFVLNHGYKFALWSAATVEPSAGAKGGSTEIAIAVEADAEVDATFDAWKQYGPKILMSSKTLEFGRSFVVITHPLANVGKP